MTETTHTVCTCPDCGRPIDRFEDEGQRLDRAKFGAIAAWPIDREKVLAALDWLCNYVFEGEAGEYEPWFDPHKNDDRVGEGHVFRAAAIVEEVVRPIVLGELGIEEDDDE